jgi:hypothetical protein
MVDLAPARRCLRRRVAQHLFDLAPALDGDGVHPGLPDPVGVALDREFVAAHREVADHATSVDDERDIGRDRDEHCSRVRVEFAERAFGRPELPCCLYCQVQVSLELRPELRYPQRASNPIMLCA